MYDFHGICDLVLLNAPQFGQNVAEQDQRDRAAGLSIHIRSSPFKTYFSYVSDVAIQLGQDTLEIGKQGAYFVNGKSQEIGSPLNLSGYRFTSSKTKKGRYVYKLHLGHGDGLAAKQEIDIREYKDWIAVSILHPIAADFHDSVGLMGSFPGGTWYGRDGVTIHDDIESFGLDWQVKPQDFGSAVDGVVGSLFHEASPYPMKCKLPTAASMRGRGRRLLMETNVTRQQAEEACAHWLVGKENCIMDVLVADDTEMAMNGPTEV